MSTKDRSIWSIYFVNIYSQIHLAMNLDDDDDCDDNGYDNRCG